MSCDTCDICDRNRETQVGGSPLGPVSLAYCKECLENRAIDGKMLVSMAPSGPEGIRQDLLESSTVFADGEYHPAEEAWDHFEPIEMPPAA